MLQFNDPQDFLKLNFRLRSQRSKKQESIGKNGTAGRAWELQCHKRWPFF